MTTTHILSEIFRGLADLLQIRIQRNRFQSTGDVFIVREDVLIVRPISVDISLSLDILKIRMFQCLLGSDSIGRIESQHRQHQLKTVFSDMRISLLQTLRGLGWQSFENIGSSFVQEIHLVMRGSAQDIEDDVQLTAVVLVTVHQHSELLVRLILGSHATGGTEGLQILGT
jgi:hypothetical protein